MRNGSTDLGVTLERRKVIGAGGWSTGHNVAPTFGGTDATFIKRTDTWNAYTRKTNDSEWTPELVPGVTVAETDLDLLYTPDGSQPDPGGQAGTWAVAIAWSDSRVRAIATFGKVFIKKTGASTYTVANIPQKMGLAPNEPNRMCGNMLEFDPANPSVLFYAAPDGLHYTLDQGANWTSVSTASLPAPTAGTRSIIRADRSSTVTGGRTQRWYIFIPGAGFYRSTDGGVGWTKLADRPTNPTSAGGMKVDPANGNVFVYGTNGETTGQVSRWNGTAWNEPAGVVAKGLAISPHTAGDIYIINSGGSLSVSTDGGVSFGGVSGVGSIAGDNIPWHSDITGGYAVSELDFDTSINTLVFTGGVGAWRYPNPPRALDFNTYPPLHCWSLGNESMVTSGIVIAPDGTRGYVMHDRGCMIRQRGDLGTFTSVLGPNPARDFTHSQGCDYAPEDNGFWIASHLFAGIDEVLGFTPDRGATWTARNNLQGLTSGRGGGQLACLSKDVWIAWQLSAYGPYGAATSDKNAPYITFNGRDASPTWQKITIGNGNAVLCAMTYNPQRRTLLKSRLTTGNVRRVYLYNPSDVDNPASADFLACRGLWAIDVNMTTQAVTVTRLVDVNISPSNQDHYTAWLSECPNGDLLWTGHDNNVGGLKRLPYGGSAWETVTGTDNLGKGDRFSEVFAAAAGKKAATSSAPHRLFVAGYRMFSASQRTNDHTQFGEWISDDNGLTWTKRATFIAGNYDQVVCMDASWDVFDERDYGFGGSGVVSLRRDYRLRAS